MKVTLNLKQWLSDNSLSIFDLLCLAFVPRRTYEDITKGVRLIPAIHRLFFVTQLEEFKVTEIEEQAYQSSKKVKKYSKNEMDEMISMKLTEDWRNGSMPKKEDRLVSGETKYQDKKILTEKLLKKFFSPRPASIQKEEVLNHDYINGMHDQTGILSIAGNEIEIAIKSSDEAFEQYLKTNAKSLKRLSMLFNVLLQTERKKALAKIQESQNNFS